MTRGARRRGTGAFFFCFFFVAVSRLAGNRTSMNVGLSLGVCVCVCESFSVCESVFGCVKRFFQPEKPVATRWNAVEEEDDPNLRKKKKQKKRKEKRKRKRIFKEASDDGCRRSNSCRPFFSFSGVGGGPPRGARGSTTAAVAAAADADAADQVVGKNINNNNKKNGANFSRLGVVLSSAFFFLEIKKLKRKMATNQSRTSRDRSPVSLSSAGISLRFILV